MIRTYKLDELATAVGVSPRTVRYYVQRGLLRAPVFRGKDTAYDDDHLAQLRAIRLLQDRFLPLDAIQEALSGLDRAGLDALLAGESPSAVTAPPPVEVVPPRAPQTWRRLTLAEGLELHLATDAPPQTVRLAEELIAKSKNPGER